jgi:hypothetical protein
MGRWVSPRVVRAAFVLAAPAILIVTAAHGALPTTAPTTAPAMPLTPAPPPPSPPTQPSVEATTRPAQLPEVPQEFAVLNSRSIFAKGKPPRVAASGPSSGPTSPDQGFVLRGVAVQGPEQTALLEDVAGRKTRQLHVGDELIGGRVVAISFEGIDRTLGGRLLHVGVGQSLDGSAPPAAGPPTPNQQTAANVPPPTGEPGQPQPGVAIPAGAKFIEGRQ